MVKQSGDVMVAQLSCGSRFRPPQQLQQISSRRHLRLCIIYSSRISHRRIDHSRTLRRTIHLTRTPRPSIDHSHISRRHIYHTRNWHRTIHLTRCHTSPPPSSTISTAAV